MERSTQNKRIHVEGESDFRRWEKMIPDVLGLIFKQLSLEEILQVIPRVCKSWLKVVEGPYCWQRIDLQNWSRRHQYMSEKRDRMLRMLVTRSLGSLLELSILFVDDDQLSFIADHAGSLQTLTLKRSTISDSIVEKLATKFSSVTTLDLSYPGEISTRALKAIGRNCKMLVSMTWDAYHHYSKDTAADEARAIAHTMPKLKHLSVANLNIDTPVALEILSGCPELESLCILGCSDVDPSLLKEKYPKVEVSGPYKPMGPFDGQESDSSEDDSLDSWSDASLGLTSSEEDDSWDHWSDASLSLTSSEEDDDDDDDWN